MSNQKYFFLSNNTEYADMINAWIANYKNGDSYALVDTLHLLDKPIRKAAEKAHQKSNKMIPADVFISEMQEAVWRAFEQGDIEGSATYITYLSNVINRAVSAVFNGRSAGGHANYAESTVLINEDSEVATVIDNIVSGQNVEAEVVNKMMRYEQRKLIDFFYEKSDEQVRAIIESFIEKPYLTANMIAKHLGVHHSKVHRELRKLAKLYDEKRFGEVDDYLYSVRG